jgi:hypothetical protein
LVIAIVIARVAVGECFAALLSGNSMSVAVTRISYPVKRHISKRGSTVRAIAAVAGKSWFVGICAGAGYADHCE